MYVSVKTALYGFFVALFVGSGLMLGPVPSVSAQEIVIGSEDGQRVEPGVILIYEAARRDDVNPAAQHLGNNKTDIHIEGRANWADGSPEQGDAPEGAPAGGFVAYMDMSAEIINEGTGDRIFVSLLPMLNLIDNYHYARNTPVPGECDDLYTVIFRVAAPDKFTLGTHPDWRDAHGNRLFEGSRVVKHEFNNIDFSLNCGLDRGE